MATRYRRCAARSATAQSAGRDIAAHRFRGDEKMSGEFMQAHGKNFIAEIGNRAQVDILALAVASDQFLADSN